MIEAYLTNKLPQSEVAAFEAELAKDPALQSEVDLQKDIINTLQDSRRLDLKNRLSAIEVKQGLTGTQKLGIAAIALSSLLLLTFSLYEATTEEAALETSPNEISENAIDVKPEPISNDISEIKTSENIVIETPVKKLTSAAETKPTQETTQNQKANTNHLVIPNPIEFEAEGSGVEHDALNAPKDHYGDNEKNEIRAITPKIENKDKKVRMYKYDGENLTLIGDFNSADPYHLIESPKNSVTELYLKFENTFYAIRETKKATELEEVTDAKTIAELSKK